jgi:purine-binding chemotaxis protein CheW
MSDRQEDPKPIEESREDLLREAEQLLEEADRDKRTEEDGPPRSLLVFSLGPEWYAVDLAHVRKVLRPGPLARVPGASAEVLGLMNCRGEVLCILDLRRILGIAPVAGGHEAEGNFVVVLHYGGKDAGFLVDGVDNAWELPASEVLPTVESLEPSRAKLFEGTVARDGRFVGVLSVSMCLNP